MSNTLFLQNGDVVKAVSTGITYLCIKTFGEEALIAPTHLNEDNEWSFFMKDQRVVNIELSPTYPLSRLAVGDS